MPSMFHSQQSFKESQISPRKQTHVHIAQRYVCVCAHIEFFIFRENWIWCTRVIGWVAFARIPRQNVSGMLKKRLSWILTKCRFSSERWQVESRFKLSSSACWHSLVLTCSSNLSPPAEIQCALCDNVMNEHRHEKETKSRKKKKATSRNVSQTHSSGGEEKNPYSSCITRATRSHHAYVVQ